jgi:hypothetical protein
MCALGLVACGHSKDAPNTTKAAVAVTSAGDCLQGPQASSIVGSWESMLQGDGIMMKMTFTFDQLGALRVNNQCQFPDGNLDVGVESSYSTSGGILHFLEAVSNESHEGDKKCGVGLEQKSIAYSFENSCLVMHDDSGKKIYFIPAN